MLGKETKKNIFGPDHIQIYADFTDYGTCRS